jgi:hypothetical protein
MLHTFHLTLSTINYYQQNYLQCVKDCENGDKCGGLAAVYNRLYDDADGCCNMLFWIERSVCI